MVFLQGKRAVVNMCAASQSICMQSGYDRDGRNLMRAKILIQACTRIH
jgi:hypothetical protein